MSPSPSLVDAGARALGSAGLTVGPLAFGCWRFQHDSFDDAARVLDSALEAGMDLVDTADIYGAGANEELLGRVLARTPGLRDRVVIATKGGIRPPVPYDSSSGALRKACESSLRRLGVEVIDLYFVHRPDLFAHPQEVAETLLCLRDEGKIRAIGVSNFTAAQHDAITAHLGEPLAASQPELSVIHLDPLRDGVLDACMRTGTAVLAWSPLAGGRLASGDGIAPELLTVLDRLAERENVDRAAIAIAFVLAHPSRPIAILGSQNPAHLAAAPAALAVHLERSDCYDLIEASEGTPLP